MKIITGPVVPGHRILAVDGDALYKIGEKIFNENGTVNSKIVKINLKIVIGAGGSGIILKKPNANQPTPPKVARMQSYVIKMSKIDPKIMENWNPNRIGKKLDGTDGEYSYVTRDYKTELEDKEFRLLNGIESRNIKLTIDKITAKGSSTSNILTPSRTIIQKIKEQWFIINGKINYIN